MRRWRLKSIYSKLLLTLLSVVAPLYGMNLYLNHLASVQNGREIARSLETQIRTYAESLELEVQRLRDLQRDYVSDMDLLLLGTSLSGMTDFEKTNATLNLQKRIQILQTSSSLIRDTKIYIPLMNRVISTYQYETSIPQAEYAALKAAQSASGPFAYIDGRLFVTFLYPAESVRKRTEPTFLLATEISRAQLERALGGLQGEDTGAMLLAPDRNLAIVSDRGPDAAAEIRRYLQAASVADSDAAAGGEAWASADGRHKLRVGSTLYFVARHFSGYLQMHVAAYVPEDKLLGPLQRYKNWFWIISIASAAILAIVSWWIYRLIHKPLRTLVNQFRRVEAGNLTLSITHRHDDEFGYLYQRFNLMVSRLHTLIQQVYEEKIRAQRAELKRLQAQINPHFLYNSHFILSRLIRGGDNETAFRFATYLGEYMQYVTRSDVDEVPLEREWRHAAAYVEIQNICFQDRLRVEFPPLPEGAGACPVTRLILQPLIENAYKYAMEPKLANGRVEIGIATTPDLFAFTIEDNGEKLADATIDALNERCRMDPDKEIEGTGLLNIHRRLQIKYGVSSGLSFSRSGLGGLKAELRIEGWRDNHVQNADRG